MASQTPSLELHQWDKPLLPFSPNRNALVESPVSGLPFSAGDRKFYDANHPSPNSTTSLFENTSKVHNFPPLGPGAPPLPSYSFSNGTQKEGLVPSNATKLQILLYLIHKTGGWVLAGVAVMLLGLVLAQAFILSKIHTCPDSASCPGSYDPNTTNVIQILQAIMSYWLAIGVMISSTGILKLSSYQAWFILVHRGNTVKNLDQGLGAIRGSLTDACLLLFKRNNRFFSLLVLASIGVGTAISLVTGLSIDRVPGTTLANFQFNGTSELPNSSAKNLNNDGQLLAIQKVIGWVIQGDMSHNGALKGSLVVPGGRSSQGVNVLPGGPKITGRLECEGVSNVTKVDNQWDIWINGTRFLASPKIAIAVSIWRVDTAVASYVWVSTRQGMIPNATQSSDGGINVALCTHWLSMVPEEEGRAGVNYLTPTTPLTSGCDSNDTNTCVADSVNNAILNWWGGLGTSLFHITCRGGALGPVTSSNESERYCPITQELWQDTATMMLDGIVQTATSSVPTSQSLEAVVARLDTKRWWVQAVIPGATVLLYLVDLAYTCFLSRGQKMLKELNLEEVVQAAQTDYVKGLVAARQLKRTMVRYDSDVGFVGSGNAAVSQ